MWLPQWLLRYQDIYTGKLGQLCVFAENASEAQPSKFDFNNETRLEILNY